MIHLKEINRLISKWMSNIYYWEKLTFSKLRFSRKENLKKCTSSEEQKGTRYIRENVYFVMMIFSCLSPTILFLRFLLTYFASEIEGFYQSSLENEVQEFLRKWGSFHGCNTVKSIFNTVSGLSQNRTQKQIMPFKTTIN